MVFMGHPRTGTSALQNFLVSHEAWLESKWGVSLGFQGSEHQKGAGLIAVKILYSSCEALAGHKDPALRRAIRFAKSKLETSSRVILSHEAFSLYSRAKWECFWRLMGKDACSSAVVLHRDIPNLMASLYAEITKNMSNPPGPAFRLKSPARVGSFPVCSLQLCTLTAFRF